MHSLIEAKDFESIKRFKQLYSRYQRNRDLINVGAYVAGSDPLLDQAVALHSQMESFLQQNMQEKVDLSRSVRELHALFPPSGGPIPQ
jgi:flagellum-specific ATP synthase